jgi:hypothetical protein
LIIDDVAAAGRRTSRSEWLACMLIINHQSSIINQGEVM